MSVPAALRGFFAEYPRIALAFSGGCDSAYLMYVAKACGAEICAYYVCSAFQPAFELADAERLAKELGVPMKVLPVDVLSDANVRANPADRCYHCKKRIFAAILDAAAVDCFDSIMDGTNASDDAADRPGMRALAQMQVLSPLRLCGVTKAQVRQYSREAGLFTWNKPAYACLATRVPTGTPIESAMLAKVERGEAALSALDFENFRLRLTDKGCRLELTESQLPLLLEKRAELVSILEEDFSEITLNLRPRKGIEI